MAHVRILVVEDAAIVAKSVEDNLKKLGYDVAAVTASGEEAVRLAAETRPDLVLMDIMLQGEMDGVEVAEQIRARFDIPVVYLTAYAEDEILQRAKITEPFGYLLKPFEAGELRVTIETALYKHDMDKRLKESEKRYRQLVETLREGIWVVDKDAYTTFVNPRMAEMMGYTVEEMQGKSLFSFMDERGVEITKRYLKRLEQGAKVKEQHDFEFLRKDGTRVYTSLGTSSITDDDGNYVGALAGVQDITERKRAEEVLKRSERELHIRNQIAHIFLTVPDGEMYAKVLQVILEAVESEYGVFGYIDEDGALVCPSMTREIWDQCHMLDKDIVFPREAWGGIWGRALIEKKTLHSNEPFHVPKGHIPIRRALDVPIIHQGEAIGNLLVGNKATDYDEEDIQLLEAIANYVAPVLNARLQRDRQERERKRAEEALRESQQLLERTFASLRDAVFIIDADTVEIIDCNPAASEIFGYSRQEMLGQTTTFLHVDEAALEEFRKHLYPAMEEKGFLFLPEFRMKRKDGTVFPTEHSVMPLEDEQGRRIGWVSVVRDIIEGKQAEEERERLILELQDALAKVKTLSGLLPICTHCKKIRDDEGYWNQLETYIQEHSEAEFTHGFCDECAKKHYPEFFGDDE